MGDRFTRAMTRRRAPKKQTEVAAQADCRAGSVLRRAGQPLGPDSGVFHAAEMAMSLLKPTGSRPAAGFITMFRSLFILAILVPGFVAALRSRYVALLMYLWFALFRPQDWLWIDITSLRLSMVLGVVLLAPAIITGVLPDITHPLSIGMALFLTSSVISQIGAVRPEIGWQWIDFLLRLFLACMLLVRLSSDEKRLVGVVAVIGGSLGFHAAKAGLAFVIGGGTRFADGLAGAFVDNGYALGTVMIMPLLIAAAQNVDVLVPEGWLRTWSQRAFYAAVPLCMFAVVGTYSRGGFVALSAAGLVFLLLQRRRFIALAVVAATALVVVAVVPIPQSYLDRLQTIQTYKEVGEDSALSRPHFWRVGLLMGMSNPFGVGLRQYEAAYDRYDFLFGRFGRKRAVHNAHVQVFAELGFLGAAVWVAMFGYAFFACLRVRARSRRPHVPPDTARVLFTLANGLLTSMTGFVVGGAFLALALNDLTWLTFAMVAAVDRLSLKLCEEPVTRPAPRRFEVPIAFRAVDSFAAARGGPS
jgi:probable O-glycosylation ligase (exosortase A-associated)